MPLAASLLISFGLMVAGILVFRRSGANWKTDVLFGTILSGSILLYVFYVVADRFTGAGINDAVIFHLRVGLAGAGFAEYRGLIFGGAGVILVGLLCCFGLPVLKRRRRESRPLLRALAFFLAAGSFVPNPAIPDLYGLFRPVGPGASDFRRYYRDPQIVATGGPKRNLVFIYAEGLERTYFDEQLFPGLISELRELEPQSIHFTDIRQVYATGYTIAGMVASQCGIYMSTPFMGNRMSGVDEYLPGALGLGDLLHREDYYLCYLGGADLDFAGKGNFYRTHKFDEVLGRQELLPLLSDRSYVSDWGLHDDSLLEIAFNRFTELSQTKDRFALFFLTLDTHQPRGHRSAGTAGIIYRDGSNPMLNAVKGADHLLATFIRRIRSSPYGDRTVVVIVSDHLAMENTATDLLEQGRRRDLFMIFEPGAAEGRTVEQTGSTLDIGTTILPFLGFTGEIGLGRNLLDPDLDEAEIAAIQDKQNLMSWSSEVEQFWEFPKLRRSLGVDVPRRHLVVDDRVYRIPALIRLQPDLRTDLAFPYEPEGRAKTLIHEVEAMDSATSFILIDRCENAAELSPAVGDHGWCIVAGRGREIYRVVPVERMKTWSRAEVTSLVSPPGS